MKILCINVTGLRPSYLGCYGNEWIETPTLDRLAAEGVVFDRHVADTPGNLPSAWVGRYRFPPRLEEEPPPLLPALLREQGIPAAFVAPQAAGADGTALEMTLDAVVAALEQLEAHDRWLLWVDLPPLLPPWRTPEDFLERYLKSAAPVDEQAEEEEEEEVEEDEGEAAEEEEPLLPLADPPVGPVDLNDFVLVERIQCSYAGTVTYLDTALGLLVEELRRRKLLDQLLLAVGGERGLALGEHGSVGDWRPWLHDELLHLPLVLRLPGATEAGRRVAALTQPIDLLPTLLAALGVAAPLDVQGHDLLPLARGQTEEVRAYACAGLTLGGAEEWALRTLEWGLVLPVRTPPEDAPRGRQLLVKPEDRWEVNDVGQHHLELADHLEATLRKFVEATRLAGPLQPPVLRDAEALMEAVTDPSPAGP